MNRYAFLLLSSSLLLISACASRVAVNTDYDTEIDFTTYKTYSWRAPNQHNEKTQAYLANDIVDKRIRNTIDSQLQAKGFVKQTADKSSATENSENVDFWVNYSVASEDRVEVKTYNTYSGYAPGWTYGGFIGVGPYHHSGVGVRIGTSVSTSEKVHYQQGTLVIDILDPRSDTLVWRGTGEGRVPKNQTTESRNKLINEAVEKILMNFPPNTDQ